MEERCNTASKASANWRVWGSKDAPQPKQQVRPARARLVYIPLWHILMLPRIWSLPRSFSTTHVRKSWMTLAPTRFRYEAAADRCCVRWGCGWNKVTPRQRTRHGSEPAAATSLSPNHRRDRAGAADFSR